MESGFSNVFPQPETWGKDKGDDGDGGGDDRRKPVPWKSHYDEIPDVGGEKESKEEVDDDALLAAVGHYADGVMPGLPPEVLDHVLDYAVHNDSGTAASLNLTSKGMRQSKNEVPAVKARLERWTRERGNLVARIAVLEGQAARGVGAVGLPAELERLRARLARIDAQLRRGF